MLQVCAYKASVTVYCSYQAMMPQESTNAGIILVQVVCRIVWSVLIQCCDIEAVKAVWSMLVCVCVGGALVVSYDREGGWSEAGI